MSELVKKAAPSCQGEGQAQNSNSTIVSFAYKSQVPLSVVETKALLLLERHATKTSSGIISYKECRRVFSWMCRLNKDETFLFLKQLEERGLLAQIAGHGVRLLRGVA